ncbi:hypothetical protein [Heyndrickxia acidicola]|uniref:Uncharacterized protein n=1 Tax=Heyndrickxia acidicola TaxID=209389 RepID=A0ABU6MIR5_9BACI|nr:hypothetical protein [Heyndrickxia acidicola]MED1204565.1 hypothetical protein [Heyndrickxia acidicola]
MQMDKRMKKKIMVNSYLCLKMGIISESEYKRILETFQGHERPLWSE